MLPVSTNPFEWMRYFSFIIWNVVIIGSQHDWKSCVPERVLQVQVLYIPRALLGRFSKLNKIPTSHIL